MILRFMGDLPEPKLSEIPMDARNESLAKRLYGSISRKLGASKQLQEGLEAEVCFCVYVSMCVGPGGGGGSRKSFHQFFLEPTFN